MKRGRAFEIALLFPTAVILVACSSAPKTAPSGSTPAPAPEKKEPVLYSGKSCLSQMTAAATRWQPDALPIHMESGLNAESNGQDGKSTIWRGVFASATRRTYRTFTCSGSRLKTEEPIGVSGSAEAPATPDVARAMFQPLMLTVDSDKAYATAQEHGGKALLEKDPNQPVFYTLDWDQKNKELVWAVRYGTSATETKGVGVINASTGKFLRAGK